MHKVVLDTNIYLSAILFGKKPEEILNLAKKGKIQALISGEILTEIAGILKRKFGWDDFLISDVIESIREYAILITPSKTVNAIKTHEPDNRILECALEGKAGYIISGDKHHILPLKEYEGIKILSASEFLIFYNKI
ncbi:MAG: putative toxin-antitoxin system toxin component, PIN family [Candidatus Acididesulfobacter diazotrophicus]|jgi:putative PIN family toxin of toxin-antitoxin system|uniref:Putative toxin-antitoxin system toxin component, PIN family n=1 Tax=Candidatus Acididesulfobacter diazotrophicus TaxID=2597226 RepID=A0A519BKE6_9DELT|nr:MAG: putative toxin-antitoxin system toxin component, PIN family [Candidatus Acididesulfobacter diazotrophicus]